MTSGAQLHTAAGDARAARRSLGGVVLAAAVAWLATRAAVLWFFYGSHSWVTGDLHYFQQSLAGVQEAGLAGTLVEYPLPGVLVVAVPWLLVEAVGRPESYPDAVLVLSLVADAAFMVLLGWFGGSRRRMALTVWVLAVPLLGATAYARFDLVPGLLAAIALLLLPTYPRVAAAAGALATGFKLWPALVLPAIAAPARTRRRVVEVVLLMGVVLAVTSVAQAGVTRLVSPLTWQAERGLQIESVAATPAMVAWAFSPATYEIGFGDHNAFEVTGQGTSALLLASEVASLLLLPGLFTLWLLAFRRGRHIDTETVAWLALSSVAAFMVTSKVLSPQYLLWLLPLAAAATALVDTRALRIWTAVLLVATAATQVVFPVMYAHVLGHHDETLWAVLTLALRNALLVWLTVRALVFAASGVARAGRAAGQLSGGVRSSASRPVPPGTPGAACGDGPPTRT